MVVQVNDPLLERQLKAERQLTGAHGFDEVWAGIYMMARLRMMSTRNCRRG